MTALRWGPERRTTRPAVSADLAGLERAVEQLDDRVRGSLPGDDVAALRRLHDELASHALAARVLVTSGAATSTIAPVLDRAWRLLARDPAARSLLS